MIDEKKLIEDLKKHFDALYKEDGTLLQSDHICISEDVEDLIKFINEQPKTDWIPCEVEMPKDETLMYWTTHEDGSIIMHGYLKRNGFIYNWEVDDLEKRKRQGNVVAWMPIFKPQPYTKEGAE